MAGRDWQVVALTVLIPVTRYLEGSSVPYRHVQDPTRERYMYAPDVTVRSVR